MAAAKSSLFISENFDPAPVWHAALDAMEGVIPWSAAEVAQQLVSKFDDDEMEEIWEYTSDLRNSADITIAGPSAQLFAALEANGGTSHDWTVRIHANVGRDIAADLARANGRIARANGRIVLLERTLRDFRDVYHGKGDAAHGGVGLFFLRVSGVLDGSIVDHLPARVKVLEDALKTLFAAVQAHDQQLDDPHGDGTGNDAESPTGDDYNELGGLIDRAKSAVGPLA